MMNAVVLFRFTEDELPELGICKHSFATFASRMDVPPSSLVVGRYSVLPYYDELERDLNRNGSHLINSPSGHRFIADVTSWADLLCYTREGLTPRTWTSWARLPPGPYVLKGRTNSRKHRWSTHMFAPTREDIPAVAARLMDDALISEQGIVVRQYVPLMRLGEGINGLPITNEWRTFWLSTPSGPVLLARGFYWAASHPEAEASARWEPEALSVASLAAEVVAENAAFFVLDVAQRADGGWTVIEVNDGQMSGLCGVDPLTLYENLHAALRN